MKIRKKIKQLIQLCQQKTILHAQCNKETAEVSFSESAFCISAITVKVSVGVRCLKLTVLSSYRPQCPLCSPLMTDALGMVLVMLGKLVSESLFHLEPVHHHGASNSQWTMT